MNMILMAILLCQTEQKWVHEYTLYTCHTCYCTNEITTGTDGSISMHTRDTCLLCLLLYKLS